MCLIQAKFWKFCQILLNGFRVIDTLRPKQNGHDFADDIFRWIFFSENYFNLIEIPLHIVT